MKTEFVPAGYEVVQSREGKVIRRFPVFLGEGLVRVTGPESAWNRALSTDPDVLEQSDPRRVAAKLARLAAEDVDPRLEDTTFEVVDIEQDTSQERGDS